MTKKDFILIAETIRFLEIDVEVREFIAKRFAYKLYETNDRFDKDRFLKACGVIE